MSLLLVLSLVGPVLAEGNGPHLMDVTQKLLRLTPEADWDPQPGWHCWGLRPGDKLRTVIYDGHGAVASATWEFQSGGPNGWAQVTKMVSRTPDHKPGWVQGRHFLSIEVNGEWSWGCDFRLQEIDYLGQKHLLPTGPWRDLAYALVDDGLMLCYWLEGPASLRWYPPTNFEVPMMLSSEVRQRGKTLLHKDRLSQLVLKPGETVAGALRVASAEELNALADGDYDLVLLGQTENGGPWPVVRLSLPIKAGKVVPNPELSGPKVDPRKFYPSTDSWFGINRESLEQIPDYYTRRKSN
ncbi:MAG: hypothetical protein KC910_06400 [Candidatus Eremiobacteraeota bacterium]|nr:hypothetical protein [Candidatus Eremiobacteraeota bacterium]